MRVAVIYPDREAQKRAVGQLAGYFSARVLKTGELIVPVEALALLAERNALFTVKGLATYEQLTGVSMLREALEAEDRRRR